jgi:integrase
MERIKGLNNVEVMREGKIAKFMRMHKKASTYYIYTGVLKCYFKTFYGEGDLEEQAERYLSEERDYYDDVERYLSTRVTGPGKTFKLHMSVIRCFLRRFDIEFSGEKWKDLGAGKKNRAVTQDRIPTIEELRKIVINLPLQGKALFLVLVSSGMRIGEAMSLEEQDLQLNSEPAARAHSGFKFWQRCL